MKVSKLDGYVDGVLIQAARGPTSLTSRRSSSVTIATRTRSARSSRRARAFEEFRDSLELQRELGYRGLRERAEGSQAGARARPPRAGEGQAPHRQRRQPQTREARTVSFDEFIARVRARPLRTIHPEDRPQTRRPCRLTRPTGRGTRRRLLRRCRPNPPAAPPGRGRRTPPRAPTTRTRTARTRETAQSSPPAQRNELSALDSPTRARNSMPRSGASDVALSHKGRGDDDMKRRSRYAIRISAWRSMRPTLQPKRWTRSWPTSSARHSTPPTTKSTTSETEQRPSCGGASNIRRTRQSPPPKSRD